MIRGLNGAKRAGRAVARICRPATAATKPSVTVKASVVSSRRGFATAAPPASRGKLLTEYSTLVELQMKACEVFRDRNCFGTRSEKGDKYEWISYGEFGRRVQKMRNVLTHHQVGKGDKVTVISNNRVEWAVAFYATVSVGAALVPMYEAQMEKDWRYIITDRCSHGCLTRTRGCPHQRAAHFPSCPPCPPRPLSCTTVVQRHQAGAGRQRGHLPAREHVRRPGASPNPAPI